MIDKTASGAWTVDQAVAFIHAARDRHKKDGFKKPGLGKMHLLCGQLGNPERVLRAVHVAGTNGKGSACACLDAVLRAAGYRVGMYTSPYLQCYAERIRINGAPIPDDAFLAAFLPVQAAVEQLRARDVWPEPFEIGTALAFVAFAQASVDLCVIEVGMGGRLDPTNVLTPLACAITAIGLDHQQLLGDTLPAIAGEKAGILKPGVPAVIAAQPSRSVDAVFAARAAALGAPLYPLTGKEMTPLPIHSSLLLPLDPELAHENMDGFAAKVQGDRKALVASRRERNPLTMTTQRAAFSYRGWALPEVRLRLLGAHQLQNAAVALAVIACMRERGLNVPDEAVLAGLAGVCWPGRLEYVPGRPNLLLDGAHNAQAVHALAGFVRTLPADAPRVLLCGVMRDKLFPDAATGGMERLDKDMAADLAGMAPCTVTTALPERRALPPGLLADVLARHGALAFPIDGVEAALAEARRRATPAGTVIVTGSLHLVGAVRALLRGEGAIGDDK